jgi:hypothetical protein
MLPTAVQSFGPPSFTTGLIGDAAAQWLYRCSAAKGKHPDRFRIAAGRYVRFARFQNPADALLDLCIALESLLDSQTEIAFRFTLTFVKLLKLKDGPARRTAELLSDLYALRSKLAHGDPAADKLLVKLLKTFPELRDIARRILVAYVLFIGDDDRDKWKGHLQSLIYA